MELNQIFSITPVHDHRLPSQVPVFGLGKNNDLIIRSPLDLKHFKELTDGHSLIMGRKTFESLGSKALPNRKMYVVSSMDHNDFEQQWHCFLARSLKSAITAAKQDGAEKAFIIGGKALLEESFIIANNIYFTNYKRNVSLDDVDVFLNTKLLFHPHLFTTKSQKIREDMCEIVPLGITKKVEFVWNHVVRSQAAKGH